MRDALLFFAPLVIAVIVASFLLTLGRPHEWMRRSKRKPTIAEAYARGKDDGWADARAEQHARRSAAATVGASTRAANRVQRDLARLVIALADAPPHDDGAVPLQGTITNGAEGPE